MKNKNIYLKSILGILILIFVFSLSSYLYNRIKEPCSKNAKAMLKRDFNIDVPVNLSFYKIHWDWDFTDIKNNETDIYCKQDIKPIYAKDKSGKFVKITEIHSAYVLFMKQVSSGGGYTEITEDEYNDSASSNPAPPSGRP